MTFAVAMIFFILVFVAVGTITAVIWFPIAPLLKEYELIYDNLYNISLFIDYIIIFLFVLPFGFGMLTLPERMRSDERVSAADAFLAYRRLPRMWLIMLISLIPVMIIAGVSYAAGWLESSVLPGLEIMRVSEGLEWMISSSIGFSVMAISVGALALAVRLFFFPGFAMRGEMSVGEALSASLTTSRGRFGEIFIFVLSFLGWAALSLATLGIIFIIHLAPYFLTSYMIYCRRIKGDLTYE